jgi:hypothetical protein
VKSYCHYSRMVVCSIQDTEARQPQAQTQDCALRPHRVMFHAGTRTHCRGSSCAYNVLSSKSKIDRSGGLFFVFHHGFTPHG